MSFLTQVSAEVDYPFLNVLWTLLIIFAWVIWFSLLIRFFADVFRRRDISGGTKTLWVIFAIIVPFIGVLTYLIFQGREMAERDVEQAKAYQASMDEYIQNVAGGSGVSEIERAKGLLDAGAITEAEFHQIKSKALGS